MLQADDMRRQAGCSAPPFLLPKKHIGSCGFSPCEITLVVCRNPLGVTHDFSLVYAGQQNKWTWSNAVTKMSQGPNMPLREAHG